MLREYTATFRYLLSIIDFFLIPPAFCLAYYIRMGPLLGMVWFDKGLGPLSEYSWLICYLIIITPIVLYLVGAYQPFRREAFFKVVKPLFIGIIAVIIFSGAVVFFRQEWVYSRSLLLGWGFIYLFFVFLQRLLLIFFLRSIRRRGFNYRRIAIFGTGKAALEVISEIQSHSFWGMQIVGMITTEEMTNKKIFALKVLGSLSDIDKILREQTIDEVYCTEVPSRKALEKLRIACIRVGCSLYVVAERKEGFLCRVSSERLGSIPLISYRSVPETHRQLFIKRAIDFLLGSLVMLIFPLIYVIVGVAIKLDSPGPVLYSSIRVAHSRRRFRCYKFRTMVKDAEKLVHLLDEVNELNGPVRKSPQDPRITRVGRFLRRYSIDEIPQFINIFKGEMSLVGPRPPLPDEVEQYKISDLRRLSMPQGITGFWQVNGRDAVKSFDERLTLDLYYIDHWSLGLDVKIILKTFLVVFKGGS